MRKMTFCAVLMLGWTMGCPFITALPPDVDVTCRGAEDCPAERAACINGLCTDSGEVDRDPPTLSAVGLSPSVGGPNVDFLLSFDVSEPLSELPTVVVVDSGVRFLLQEKDDPHYRFVLSAAASGLPSGAYAVAVDVKDVSGNTAMVAVGEIEIDIEQPELLSFDLATPSISAATDGLLDFAVSEPLAATPRVVMESGGLEVEWTVAAVEPQTYAATLAVDALNVPAGSYAFRVEMMDPAENRSVRVPPESVLVDVQAPAIENVTLSATLLMPGVPLVVVLQTDEFLADGATLRVDGPGGEREVSGVVSGASATFSVLFEDADEGPQTLRVDGLEDLAGNSAMTLDIGVVQVDATAPSFSQFATAAPIYSEVPGYAEVELTFDVSENLDDAPVFAVRLGTADMACGAYQAASPHYTCTGTIDANDVVNDQFVVVQATAVDAAGNTGLDGITAVIVDVTPPSLLPDPRSVVLSGHPNFPGVLADKLYLGSRAAVSFRVSEDLAVAPTVASTPAPLVFAVTSAAGNDFTLEATLDDINAVEGPLTLTVTLTDLYGHTTTVPLELPPPGIDIAFQVPSPCVAEVGGVPVPTDFDGDGHFGFGPGCASPQDCLDCDDADPLTYPGAPEILADGRDNSCGGGPGLEMLDESVAVFFDAAAAGGGDGTRASPFNDIFAAFGAANATGKALALAANDFVIPPYPREFPPGSAGSPANVDIYGGLDPITWAPGGQRTRLGAGEDMFASANLRDIVISGLSIDPGPLEIFGSREVTLADVHSATDNNGSPLYIATGARVVHSDVGNIFFDGPQPTRLIQNTLRGNPGVFERSEVLVLRNQMFDARVNSTSPKTAIVANVFAGRSLLEDYSQFGETMLINNSVRLNESYRPMVSHEGNGVPATTPTVHLVNNAVYVAPDAEYAMVVDQYVTTVDDATAYTLFGNAVATALGAVHTHASPNFPVLVDYDNAPGLAGLSACPQGGNDMCLGQGGNIQLDLTEFTGGVPVPPVGSPLTGQGVNVWATLPDAPTAAVGDFLGACRPLDTPAIGAYEP